jgi:pimeloyl-ACP methyl ester carboxylesterase
MSKSMSVLAAIVSVAAIWLAMGGQSFSRVNAGGPSLRMLRTGSSGPTVVFEAGSGGPLEVWTRVQPEVSKITSTIAYDRAGNGLSDKGPVPRDGRRIVDELHTALQNAHATPPYILVGHSLGGPYIRVFAGTYPNEVAGMVLVDPTQEELIAWAKARDPKPEHKPRPYDEVDCAPATFAEAHESHCPPGIPVVLIAGMGPRAIPGFLAADLKKEVRKDQTVFYPAKRRFYQEWLAAIPGAKLVVTEESGHGIPLEEPELIIREVRQMVEQVRSRDKDRR